MSECVVHVVDKGRMLDDRVLICENCGKSILDIIAEAKRAKEEGN